MLIAQSPTQPFAWIRGATAVQKRTLIAASLGWMLDSMDVMLYALALPAIRADLQMSVAAGGLIMSLTLIAAAAGGILFGSIADRFGRTKTLTATILLYSSCTALCAFAHSPVQLGIFRVLLGFGMGGEWAAGAALVAESWPTEKRGKALGLVQSAWAIGYALAALLVAVVLPHFGWRAVFLFGALPGLIALWVRRKVPEPVAPSQARGSLQGRGSIKALFAPPLRGRTILFTAMNAASLFAYWGLFFWVPQYLAAPLRDGGRGLNIVQTATWTALMQAGTFLGYVCFGVIADAWSRKWTYIGYLCVASALVPIYAGTDSATLVLWLGPLVGFFGTGYFSGFSVMASESFPYVVRGIALGFCYNLGRIVSAGAPLAIGRLSGRVGIGAALSLTSVGFVLAALLAVGVKETRGRELS
ncbi:MAG TPA: MFS transporter [Acidobacteriaceae bacterium]|nr:MFS transporter [Acidobacteriaceae bacterium]